MMFALLGILYLFTVNGQSTEKSRNIIIGFEMIYILKLKRVRLRVNY